MDDELLRTYRNVSGREVQLYVGCYRSQQNGKELTGDASRALQKVSSSVRAPPGTGTLDVKEVIQQRAEGPRGVIFWYVVNGRIVSNIYMAKLYTLWDAMTKWRTRGVVVMVAWDGAKTDADRSRAAAIDFAQALLAQPSVHELVTPAGRRCSRAVRAFSAVFRLWADFRRAFQLRRGRGPLIARFSSTFEFRFRPSKLLS